MAVADAARSSLPYHLSAICAYLKTITILPCIILITHISKKCHIYRSLMKQEGLKVKAEILTKTIENLERAVVAKRVSDNHYESDRYQAITAKTSDWHAVNILNKQKAHSHFKEKITPHVNNHNHLLSGTYNFKLIDVKQIPIQLYNSKDYR
ncbi:hypothetical protein IEQ34_003101 [Dendrobium chrysotoxum]|uniref:Uncharacterized protein n=1 Tax=Dendrobium chrysotoxum TaxID=161865 RepID=A0AAV7HKC6_DENCH|nr:hypothetical protein IEQ34_003101 [Dendrobium chrysotoxum]